MGSNISKKNEASVQTCKNNLSQNCSSDPRSPTPEITRTPLQGNAGCKHNITKNVDLRNSFENEADKPALYNNPILTAVIKNHLLTYDPRSPTQAFQRTPIIITSKLDELENDLKQDKPLKGNDEDITSNNYSSSPQKIDKSPFVVPKNLHNKFLDMSLNDTVNETEKVLSESTAANEAMVQGDIILHSENGKDTAQVLETNFDYLEVKEDDDEQNEEIDTEQTKSMTLNCDTEFVNTGTHFDVSNVLNYKILEADPRSPTTGIERTPIIVAKDKIDLSDDNVEEMSDDNLIKVLQDKNAALRGCVGVHKADNSGELLIYEDQAHTHVNTPKLLKAAASSSNISRTPLSCMKNKAETSQIKSLSANGICGTKDKAIKRVSHIPRLKALSKQSKVKEYCGSSVSLKSIPVSSKPLVMNGDCENTPPHSHRERWDKDNSIVL